MKNYPFYSQLESADCGPACLKMIAKYYGKKYSSKTLRNISKNGINGSTLTGIGEAAEAIGLKSLAAKLSFEKMKLEAPLPAIVYWQQRHFVVVYEINGNEVIIGDPSLGIVKCTHKVFLEGWVNNEVESVKVGIALLIEPTFQFYQSQEVSDKWDYKYILSYLKPHYRLLFQVLIGMVVGSFFQLLLPFLTQSIVDKGIAGSDINFINLILVAQLSLLLGRMIMDFIQSRIFLYIGAKLGLSILSDYLNKLMSLPAQFFESKTHGDLIQRMSDSGKIQSFLTGTTLSIIISFFNLLLYGGILLLYNIKLFFVYIIGSLIHGLWSLIFLRKQRELNFKLFDNSSNNQNVMIQIISGIQDIKLYNCERKQRERWEIIQAKSYYNNKTNLNFGQIQQTGSFFINETKNIIITYLTVTSVINGDITLGMMLSVQYIIGQLNGPVSAFMGLTSDLQQIKISIERLGEIYKIRDEEKKSEEKTILEIPQNSILLKNVSFYYQGDSLNKVLKDITLEIPVGKVTAIVGGSGSGKSTLMKLMLGLYDPTEGDVYIGNTKLKSFSLHSWRDKCGSVIQDGFIFSDSISSNITMFDENVNYTKLENACFVANIKEFIDSLPLNYSTVIGSEGVGLSQGQKQRLLIARSIYKNPDFIFLDEATNSLDAKNERIIVENLRSFFEQRTVVIIAHRLSTVIDADNLVVLDKGQIVEQGTHYQLLQSKGVYYNLIKNQMELAI